MGKRSYDTFGHAMTPTDPPKPPKKSERTHEENKERAFIAASRRTDRSFEARYGSAKAASEIHFKRTGKHFNLTPEIVMNGEMYEEEDVNGPRRLATLGSHLTTGPMLNDRVSAYLHNTAAISQAVQQIHEEVNRQFAEAFPGAALLVQPRASQMQPMYNSHMLPFYSQANPPLSSYSHSPYTTTYTAPHPTQSPLHDPEHGGRTQSLGQIEQQFLATTAHDMSCMASGGPPLTRHASLDSNITPALTPGSTRTDTPLSNITPPEYAAGPPFCRPDAPSTVSVNARGLVAGLDNIYPNGFCGDGGEYVSAPSVFDAAFTFGPGQANNEVVRERDIPIPSSEAPSSAEVPVSTEAPSAAMPDTSGLLDADSHMIEPTALRGSRTGTPDGGGDDSWEQWVQKDQLNGSLDRDGA